MSDILNYFSGDDTLLQCLDCCLSTVLDLEFIEDMFEVGFIRIECSIEIC